MKKKLLCIALAALMLSACEEAHKDGDPSETTELTLIESLTEDTSEPLPEPEPPQTIEFALFDPFYGKAKLYENDETLQSEMQAAAEKISDALCFLSADFTGFYQKSKYFYNYADTENPLETSAVEEYSYCPLNTEIAQTEEELFGYLRGCFTENYVSDEEMKSWLFETDEYGNVPEYKTIDGTLCMREQYMGVGTTPYFDQTSVLSYDGKAAELAVYGTTAAYPPRMVFMNIVNSEEYGWRLDSIEYKDYNEMEAAVMYNGITLRADTLNKILGGGNPPENAAVTTIDGETYTQTDLDMTIDEMREFVADMFENEGLAEIYVDNVYAEQEGELGRVLFRRDSAWRRYAPELRLDPFYGLDSTGGGDGEFVFSCKQEFYDSVKDESFFSTISMICGQTSSYNEAEEKWEYEYHYLHITSDLPIRTYEEE